MESVGILVVSYGSRAASFVDAFSRSDNYKVNLFIADKQKNPFNLERAEKHTVIPDLSPERILDFVKSSRDAIDFGIIGPEGPIIAGTRDLIEKETEIPIICPTKTRRIIPPTIIPIISPVLFFLPPTGISFSILTSPSSLFYSVRKDNTNRPDILRL